MKLPILTVLTLLFVGCAAYDYTPLTPEEIETGRTECKAVFEENYESFKKFCDDENLCSDPNECDVPCYEVAWRSTAQDTFECLAEKGIVINP